MDGEKPTDTFNSPAPVLVPDGRRCFCRHVAVPWICGARVRERVPRRSGTVNMRPKAIVLLTCIAVLAAAAAAQDTERYFRFVVRQRSEVGRLARSLSIARVAGDTVYAYAADQDRPHLRSMGYDLEDLPHPGSGTTQAMASTPSGMAAWDRYPTYQAYLEMMRDFAARFPAICRLDTIGLSAQGRLLLALKISDNAAVREDEPQCLYTSSMHGNEVVGYVLLLRLADYLLNNYGVATAEGTRATRLVDNIELWINPLFNPDGTYRLGGDTTVANSRRFNANGYDLNRNFPDRIADSNNTTSGRQPETAAMMTWTAKHNFSLSANFHCGVQVVNYPWDAGAASGSYSACPDDAWFTHLSREYATPNPDLMGGGFTNGITNGCEWYAVFGGRQDWMYVWHGGREVTIELSNANIPAADTLPTFWQHNQESFLAYLEQSVLGIRGVVTNAVTGAPVKAQVDVLGIPNVPVFTDSAVGDYHRLLLPGTYSLVVRASDFRPDTVDAIEVTATAATRADVALQPLTVAVASGPDREPEEFGLYQNYPNPFNPVTTIEYAVAASGGQRADGQTQGREAGTVKLVVFDLLGREVAELVNEPQVAGRYTVTFDAGGLASGTYVVRLRAGGGAATRRMQLIR